MSIRADFAKIQSGVCPDCGGALREWELGAFAFEGRKFSCDPCDRIWGITQTALAAKMHGDGREMDESETTVDDAA